MLPVSTPPAPDVAVLIESETLDTVYANVPALPKVTKSAVRLIVDVVAVTIFRFFRLPGIGPGISDAIWVAKLATVVL